MNNGNSFERFRRSPAFAGYEASVREIMKRIGADVKAEHPELVSPEKIERATRALLESEDRVSQFFNVAVGLLKAFEIGGFTAGEAFSWFASDLEGLEHNLRFFQALSVYNEETEKRSVAPWAYMPLVGVVRAFLEAMPDESPEERETSAAIRTVLERMEAVGMTFQDA